MEFILKTFYGWLSKTSDPGPALRQISYFLHVLVLEGKLQDRSLCLFPITLGGNALDQRSGTVDTIDDLKPLRSVQGRHFTNFEMLDMKIVSALNKIIQNSYSRKRVRLEEQRAQTKIVFFGDDRMLS